MQQNDCIIKQNLHNSPSLWQTCSALGIWGLYCCHGSAHHYGLSGSGHQRGIATEVSVEFVKPISLLSNQALGPVLHSLIQMRVECRGLAKFNPRPVPPLLTHNTHLHVIFLQLLSQSFVEIISYVLFFLCMCLVFLPLTKISLKNCSKIRCVVFSRLTKSGKKMFFFSAIKREFTSVHFLYIFSISIYLLYTYYLTLKHQVYASPTMCTNVIKLSMLRYQRPGNQDYCVSETT